MTAPVTLEAATPVTTPPARRLSKGVMGCYGFGAAAYGVKSFRVEDPADLKDTLARAIAHDGPTLVDVITQPLQDARAPVSEWVA